MSATVSNTEKRIISSCLLNPTAYNIPLFVRFEEGLDIPKMYNLLTRYLEQFELFRTFYSIDDKGIGKRISETLPIIEVRTFKQLDQDLLMNEQMITIKDHELVRLMLCRVQEQTHDYLFINIHHVLMDGFSMNLFLQELMEAYLSAEPVMSKLSSQLPEVGAQRVNIETQSILSFENYGPFKTKLLSKQVDEVHYVNDLLRLSGSSVKRHSDFAVALTAFSISVAQWLGSGNAYLAYPYLGRDPQNYRALGNFVQLVPFHRQLEDDLELGTDELISQIQKCIFASFAGRDFYDELIHTEKMNSMNIFRDLIFDYKSGSLIAKTLSEAQEIMLEEATGYRDEKYGLHFSVYRNGEELELCVISSEYSLEELQALLALFQSNIRALYDNEGGLLLGDLLKLGAVEEVPQISETLEEQAGKVYTEVANMVYSLLEGEADVGANVSFFDLGMDSLLLVKFKRRIRETFNINLKISDFFNFHTAELLSVKIMDHLKEAN